MKQVWYEWKKLISDKSVLLVVVLSMCIVLGYQWKNADSYAWQRNESYREYYEDALTTVEKMDAETARQWLQEESAWQSFLLSAAYGDSDMAFELLQMNAPEVDWNKRLKENANEKTDIQQTQQKYQAFTKLLERVNYAISYAEFLESVKTQAQSMSKLSLFSDVDSFSQKNIQKTAEAYEKMSSVQPGLTYSDAADAWSDSALADVIVPGLLLFLGWAIFQKEKEAGLYQLLGSTKRGHLEMALAKTIVYFFFAVLLAILLYGSQIVLAILMYGTGDMTLALISIPSFRNCPYPISIQQYLILYLGVKVLAALFYASVIMAMLTRRWRFGIAASACVVVICLEYLAYDQINSVSKWNALKYLNLAAVIDAKAWFCEYHNLNILSQPFSVVTGKLLLVLCGIILLPVLACISFSKETRESGKLPRGFQFVANGMAKLCAQHRGLFWHEGYKLYKLGAMAVVIILLLFFNIRLLPDIESHKGNTDQQVYQYYIEKLSGAYTQESRDYLQQEQQLLNMEDEEAVQKRQQYEQGELSEDEYEKWQMYRQLLSDTRKKGFQRVMEQAAVIEKHLSVGEKAGFVDVDQLAYLFQDNKKQTIFAMIFAAVFLLGATALFGIERQAESSLLLQSTKLGKRPVAMCKLMQMIVLASVIAAILYVPYDFVLLKNIERVPMKLSLNTVIGYEKFELSISIRHAFLLKTVLQYFSVISVCIVVSLLAYRLNPASEAILCFLFFLMPCFLYWLGVDLSTWTWLGLFLPELIFVNGGVARYYIEAVIVLIIDMKVVFYFWDAEIRIYRSINDQVSKNA